MVEQAGLDSKAIKKKKFREYSIIFFFDNAELYNTYTQLFNQCQKGFRNVFKVTP